ncbi:MAG: methylated-DNA--[protein]-cysteine S-methyltransferase [Actinomycetota bacterium]|nr:methylated-DNA--[protein]-cysteine S-methyltransferase [Actinomycetota bacterium]
MYKHDTPCGPLVLAASDTGITICSFADLDTVRARYPTTAGTGTKPAERTPYSTARELDALDGEPRLGTKNESGASAPPLRGDGETGRGDQPVRGSGGAATIVEWARRELNAYFAGDLRRFTVPVDLRYSNAFDRSILTGLSTVDYGETTTYGALARTLNLPTTAARGVGGAMAGNPVLVIVPCHRVLGVDGALVGYAGGLGVKRRLLDLETADRFPQLDLLFSA